MNACTCLLAEAMAAGLVVCADGEQLVVHAYGRPLREVLSEELRARLCRHKAELLLYLTRRERGIEMICATFARLSDAYPIGCAVSGTAWRQAEALIDAAYERACRDGGFEELERALAEYERFAMGWYAEQAASKKAGGA